MLTQNRTLLSALLVALAGAPALAAVSYSTVNAPPGGEPGEALILGNIYGGTWTQVGSTSNFTNGTLTASRLADLGGSSTPTAVAGTYAANSMDQYWSAGSVTITAWSKNAGDTSLLGWLDDTTQNPAFHSLLNTGDLNDPVTATLSSRFRWALSDQSTSTLLTSRPLDNISGSTGSASDQMIAYSVSGLGRTEWALFFEDRTPGQGSDMDYNDAVVTVTPAASGLFVPAPGATALLMAGGGLLVLRRKR